jgi:hypothetical protein
MMLWSVEAEYRILVWEGSDSLMVLRVTDCLVRYSELAVAAVIVVVWALHTKIGLVGPDGNVLCHWSEAVEEDRW